MNTASTRKKKESHFTAGDKVKIYQKPMTQEDFEEEATLIRCIRTHKAFDYAGLLIEEWYVKFADEEAEYARIIAIPSLRKGGAA